MLQLATQTDNVSVSNAARKRLQDWGIAVVNE